MTAELAVLLPAVFLVLALSLASLGLEAVRIDLVGQAATSARALARAEPIDQIRQQLMNQSIQLGFKPGFGLTDENEMVCVKLTKSVDFKLLNQSLKLTESSCARRGGL